MGEKGLFIAEGCSFSTQNLSCVIDSNFSIEFRNAKSLQDVHYLKKNTEHLFFNKCLMKNIQNLLFYDNENINHISKLCKLVNETEKKMHSKVWKSAVGTKLPT